ncbi:Mini-ribonuclease 3 [Oribacterium sp. WCC10]|uniref:Mini-ribonuclease 3 n=1 Tax=Oribacterium sp. WCC10 TaxID=1855343 RepID=UPI0008EBEF43|nr:ribonuclease III domain-containing protein [Oribacterium sp. WCC10]SFG48469.1 ribonuclease-3 family protein [Oribacterium sp. WCC10]
MQPYGHRFENMINTNFEHYKKMLNIKAVDVQTTSPLILAYIGDGIYDLAVREYVATNFPGSVNSINHKKTEFVCAHAQSEIMGWLIGQNRLNDDEMSVYRRGRNHKSSTHSKNSSIQDYRRATGFEALLGYLYLTEQYDRLIELEAAGIGHLQELLDTQGYVNPRKNKIASEKIKAAKQSDSSDASD